MKRLRKTQFSREKIVFHQGNAPTHKFILAIKKNSGIKEKIMNKEQIIIKSSLFTSFNLTGLNLFLKLIKFISRKMTSVNLWHFSIKWRGNNRCRLQYKDGEMVWNWNKCISVKDDYAEKLKFILNW